VVKIIKIIDINNETSLNLLNVYALNALFSVLILDDQKLINKNDVKPINSQPKKKTIKFPLETNKTILITKQFINKINLSKLESYLKYEYT